MTDSFPVFILVCGGHLAPETLSSSSQYLEHSRARRGSLSTAYLFFLRRCRQSVPRIYSETLLPRISQMQVRMDEGFPKYDAGIAVRINYSPVEPSGTQGGCGDLVLQIELPARHVASHVYVVVLLVCASTVMSIPLPIS